MTLEKIALIDPEIYKNQPENIKNKIREINIYLEVINRASEYYIGRAMGLEYFQEVASGEAITGYYTEEHVAGLTEDLRSLVLESFFDNEDLIRFLQYKNSRDAALKNLKDQQSEITNYTQELDNAVKKASQNIEQAVSGLISLEFEKQVDVYKEKADPDGGWFYRFFKYKPQNNQGDLQESVNYWYYKRQYSIRYLWFYVIFVICVFALLNHNIYKDFQFTIITLKISMAAILYSNYYFAQKNYRIYASLRNQYQHKLVNAKMLSGYMAVKNRDEALYKKMVENVMELLTKTVDDHNFKESGDNDTISKVIQNYSGIKTD